MKNRRKPDKDAYGQEVMAFLRGENVSEIVERDDGFIDNSRGATAYFEKYKKWNKLEKKAIRFAKGKVLDVGCGAGRVSLYLQGKGRNVISIDNSPLAIKVCKERGLRDARVMGIEDVGKFRKNSFDSVVMFGNNFGLFGSFRNARRLLGEIYDITSPEALIIAETRDPYKTESREHLEYHELNRRRGRMAGQLRIRIRYRKYVGDWFDYLLVSKKEMENILGGTGWRVKKYIDVDDSPSYFAVLEKIK